jgi:hypothetical protein
MKFIFSKKLCSNDKNVKFILNDQICIQTIKFKFKKINHESTTVFHHEPNNEQ